MTALNFKNKFHNLKTHPYTNKHTLATQCMPTVEQDLLMLLEHIRSRSAFGWVRVAQFLFSNVVVFFSLFVGFLLILIQHLRYHRKIRPFSNHTVETH